MGALTRRTWLAIGAVLAFVVAIALVVTLHSDEETDNLATGTTARCPNEKGGSTP
jgi:hypothetical protein